MGKDVIRLSLPPDAVSDTQDFDGTEFEILPDGELRAAETVSYTHLTLPTILLV